jgi:predicted ester cyclase
VLASARPTGRARQTAAMTTILDRALRLWTEPIPIDDVAARRAFAGVYADPVTVNGASVALQDIVDRARMMQGAFADLQAEVQEQCSTVDHLAFAFRLSGRHVGPFTTTIGTVPATGRSFSVLAMDIFAVAEDRVIRIWAVADQLDLLAQAGAVALTGP